ncbi:unnamed protein product, partial [Schistosoma mattheei]
LRNPSVNNSSKLRSSHKRRGRKYSSRRFIRSIHWCLHLTQEPIALFKWSTKITGKCSCITTEI